MRLQIEGTVSMINEGLESKQYRLGRVEPLSHLAKPTRREAGAHNSCLLAAEHRLQIASNNCSLKTPSPPFILPIDDDDDTPRDDITTKDTPHDARLTSTTIDKQLTTHLLSPHPCDGAGMALDGPAAARILIEIKRSPAHVIDPSP